MVCLLYTSSLDTLSEIAAHLNCDISELITGAVPSHQDYLNEEFAQVYDRMDTHQKNILLEIAHVILHLSLIHIWYIPRSAKV